MKTLIKYVNLTASRDRLFLGMLIAVIAAYGLAVFIGSTALSEQSEMSTVLFAGIVRMVLNIGFIIFACFHIRNNFDLREIESILSKPISRTSFIVGYWLSFCFICLKIIIPAALIFFLFGGVNHIGLLFWTISIFLEISLVLAFAIVSALILRSAASAVMASIAFYITCRLIGFFIAAMQNEASLMGQGFMGNILMKILEFLSYVIPRLDLFAKSSWLIYGIKDSSDYIVFFAQAAIFIGILLYMAIFDLKRKQF